MEDGTVTVNLGNNARHEEVYVPEDYCLDPPWPDDTGWYAPFGWKAKHLEDYDVVE